MEARRKWADSESDEEEDEKVLSQERVITSLPSLEVQSKSSKPKKRVKVKKEEAEEKLDPNLITKLTTETKSKTTNLRTTASKKEIKEKELEELNKLLSELGDFPQPQPTEEEIKKSEKEQEKNPKKNKPKTSKKELIENARSEIAARNEKIKKNKKSD